MDNKIRIFIDPATKNTGYAIFGGDKLIQHGAINAEDKLIMTSRLKVLVREYDRIADIWTFDEVIFERQNKVSYRVSWGVGAIMAGLGHSVVKLGKEISPTEWQAFHGLTKKDKDEVIINKVLEYYPELKITSEDEAVAILIGLKYLDKIK